MFNPGHKRYSAPHNLQIAFNIHVFSRCCGCFLAVVYSFLFMFWINMIMLPACWSTLPWQKGLKSSNTRANSREDVLLPLEQFVVIRSLRHLLDWVNLLQKNEKKLIDFVRHQGGLYKANNWFKLILNNITYITLLFI